MRATLAVVCTVLLAFTAAPHTQNAQLTIDIRVEASVAHGPVVTGSMELTLVNAIGATLGNVKLAIAPPALGALGDGTLELGTVDADATVVRRVDFELDQASFDSSEPLLISLGYDDQAGQRREVIVPGRRVTTGGGL